MLNCFSQITVKSPPFLLLTVGSSLTGLQQQGYALGLCAAGAGAAPEGHPHPHHPSHRRLQHGRLPGRPGRTEEYVRKVGGHGGRGAVVRQRHAHVCNRAAPARGAPSSEEHDKLRPRVRAWSPTFSQLPRRLSVPGLSSQSGSECLL